MSFDRSKKIEDRLLELVEILEAPRWWELLGQRYGDESIPRTALLAGELMEAAAALTVWRPEGTPIGRV